MESANLLKKRTHHNEYQNRQIHENYYLWYNVWFIITLETRFYYVNNKSKSKRNYIIYRIG